jgi:hypothetical protein
MRITAFCAAVLAGLALSACAPYYYDRYDDGYYGRPGYYQDRYHNSYHDRDDAVRSRYYDWRSRY